jgi:quercetin dioxygenase-like cupin family protein
MAGMSNLNHTSTVNPSVVAAGDGERIWFTNAEMTVKATAESTDGQLSLMETQAPEGHGPPLHIHHEEHECFYVLAGELEVLCGEERYQAGPGAFAFLPSGIPHTFKVTSGPARFLTFGVPGGLDGFFREAGRPAAGLGLPPVEPPDIARLAQVAAKYGSEILGPPLS